MSRVGLHIRIDSNMNEAIEKAITYKLPTFQSFLVNSSGRYINPTNQEVKDFLKLRENFKDLFIHSSFWINWASSKSYNLRLIRKELDLAKKLKFTHLVIHPGSAKEYETKEQGINLLAKRLNKILKDEKDIIILLENTAHGKKTIGNDLQDLKLIQEKVQYPLKFCLDTAHAYAYGYDFTKNLDKFLKLVDTTIGTQNIELIHLNDSVEALGSKKDKHTIPGEGKIGLSSLKKILNHPKFKNIPAIIELPPKTTKEQEERALKRI